MKKRILLDVDGVLAAFHERAIKEIRELFDLDITMQDFPDWDVTHVLENEEDRSLLNSRIHEPGWATSLEPYPQAIHAVQELRRNNIEIMFATSPNQHSDTWMRERDKWLIRHFGMKFDEIAHIHKKYWLVADMLVDDKISNVLIYSQHHPGKHALLWDQTYNRKDIQCKRALCWDKDVLAVFI